MEDYGIANCGSNPFSEYSIKEIKFISKIEYTCADHILQIGTKYFAVKMYLFSISHYMLWIFSTPIREEITCALYKINKIINLLKV